MENKNIVKSTCNYNKNLPLVFSSSVIREKKIADINEKSITSLKFKDSNYFIIPFFKPILRF